MIPAPAPLPSHDDIFGLLRAVVDPELGVDIVTLGMVPGVDIRPDGHVAWRADSEPHNAHALIDTVRGASITIRHQQAGSNA